jgi:hypothetical protein
MTISERRLTARMKTVKAKAFLVLSQERKQTTQEEVVITNSKYSQCPI